MTLGIPHWNNLICRRRKSVFSHYILLCGQFGHTAVHESVFAARSGLSPLCTGNTALQYPVQRCYCGHTVLELSAMLLWAYRIGIVCYVTVGMPHWNCLLCYCGRTTLELSAMLLWAYRFGIVCCVAVGIPLWNCLLC